MPRDLTRDPFSSHASGLGAPARKFYSLTNAMIGSVELPEYARALRVRMGSSAPAPVVLIVVPIAEDNDASTVTLTVDATELLPFGVRRILSVNGGSTIPSGVSVDLITV